MPDSSKAEFDALRRQNFAGSEGTAKLTEAEKNQIVKANLEKATQGVKSDVIPPEINQLIIKQTNAGQPGHPNLTDEEREILKKFYASRS